MVIAEIRKATIEDAQAIAANVREADRREIWASHMMTPLEAMEYGLKHSEFALTGLADGVPVCMWGGVRASLIMSVGVPWMVTARALEQGEVAAAFIRRCKKSLQRFLKRYDILVNYVDARNYRAIRWLKYMGFTLQDARPYGFYGLPFHKFEMRRK